MGADIQNLVQELTILGKHTMMKFLEKMSTGSDLVCTGKEVSIPQQIQHFETIIVHLVATFIHGETDVQ